MSRASVILESLDDFYSSHKSLGDCDIVNCKKCAEEKRRLDLEKAKQDQLDRWVQLPKK